MGYGLADEDREEIATHSRHLICRYCTLLIKEATRAKCGHTFCLSCLQNNLVNSTHEGRTSSVAVCPIDTCRQEIILGETQADEQVETQVRSVPISCPCKFYRYEEHCEWKGYPEQIEMHLRDYRYHDQNNREAAAKVNEAFQHGTQLSTPLVQVASPCPGTSMSLEGSLLYLPGPGGEQSWRDMAQGLLHQQNKDHQHFEKLKQQIDVLLSAYNTEKRLRENLQDEVRTVQGKLHIILEQRQFLAGTDIKQIKQQLEALGNDVVSGKQHHEQLQEILRVVMGQVQELQSGDGFQQLKLAELTNSLATVIRHGENLQEELRGAVAKVQDLEQQQRVDQNAAEELKRHSVEKRDHQLLQEKVRIAEGKIQALEQELAAHKNRCDSAQAECVTERARGIEALNMQGGVLHNYIGRLQSSVARVQGSQANLEEQFGRLEIERGFHGQGL